uniref:Uncharacterized protein n=1 Tax=Parascaris equorum TaxID=6256 RepID=A0A914S666_PAREQ
MERKAADLNMMMHEVEEGATLVMEQFPYSEVKRGVTKTLYHHNAKSYGFVECVLTRLRGYEQLTFLCSQPDRTSNTKAELKRFGMKLHRLDREFGSRFCNLFFYAFKPLMKKSKGRIISASSIAGRISFIGAGPYTAAKYAVEAYMDTIRSSGALAKRRESDVKRKQKLASSVHDGSQELRILGVNCSILEPGIFKTNLIDKDAMKRRVEH